jgi:hypothetical protein
MYSKWINLSLETRNKIAEVFDIVKKGSVEVFSNTIKSDGYLIADIDKAITVSSMQSYLGSKETDSNVLFDMLVNKFEPKPEVVAQGEIAKIEVMPVEAPKKKVVKKVKKNASKKR